MNAPAMHPQVASASQRQCDGCPSVFTPTKRWQRFCTVTCQRAWHRARDPRRLLKEIDRLKAALRPLAELACEEGFADKAVLAEGITAGDVRRARKLLG